MSATLTLVAGPLGAALLIAAIGYSVLAAEKRQPALDVDTPVPFLPADDLMAIADAVHGAQGDDFDQWLARELARPTRGAGMSVDELARRRAVRSVR